MKIKILVTAAIIATALLRGAPVNSAIVSSFTDTMNRHKISQLSNHTIKFTTPTGVGSSTDTIIVTFESGFTLTGMDFGDVDLSHGPTTGSETEETIASAAAAGTWGASFSGQALTLTPPTDAGGSEIAASDIVIIEIGTNATAGTAGDEVITNPSSAGSYSIFVGGAFGDEGSVGVPIVSDEQAAVSATVTDGPTEGSGGGPPPPPPPGPPPDVTPPIISNIQVTNIGQTSAKVTWTTNEPATSIVEYGKTVAYGSQAGDGLTLVYNHTVFLAGLSSGTLYHFRVKSADGSGNLATSADDTFTTLAGIDLDPPIISDVQVIDITGTRATVTWTTDEPADGAVEYGLTNAYGSAVSDPTLATVHSLTLIGLTSDTVYHFRVRSIDFSGNEGFSDDQTFRTLDVTPPVISNIQVVDITETSARVTWDTDEPADSAVDYGLTDAYGSTRSSAGLTTNHSILLTDLVGSTTYHFRVRSSDASGNEAVSGDRTFRTAPDVTPPPNVNNFRVIAVTDTSITLAWDPPISPDYRGARIQMSTVDFPAGVGEGINVYDGSGVTVIVPGLTPSTTYFFTAFAYDAVRNYASGAITFGSTLALPPPPPEVPPIPPEIPPAIPPEIPPAPPPIPLPPVTVPPVERISLDDLNFFVAGRTLELIPQAGVVRALGNLIVTVTISRDAFTRTPRRVILNVGSNSYLMEENIGRNAFEVGFTLPDAIGTLPSAVIVQYADGSEDAVEFSFNLESHGIVFEQQNGIRVPVPAATVTLFSHDGGKIVWDASFYSQINPITTGDNGAFSYLVPAGFYSLEAAAVGYRKGETPIFVVTDVIVNRDIEIFRIPPPLREVIKPEAPLLENIIAVTKNLSEKTVFTARIAREQAVKVVDDPVVEQVNQTVAAPAVATIAIANVSAAAGILPFLTYLRFLFTQPLLLLQRKKRKGWGIIYHSLSKLPIDLAIVRLIDAATLRPVGTRVTDKAGRYAFVVGPGAYKLEVTKPGFIFPTDLLAKEKEDAGYPDLYHGEVIQVSEEGVTIAANIPLDPIERMEIPRRILFRKYLRMVNTFISIVSVLTALASLIITPTPLFAALLAVQVLFFLIFQRLARPRKPKGWGIIYDEETKNPIRLVIARIFETKYNKLLETQITDGRGRYNFLVGRSKYYVTYEKVGYETKISDVFDFTKSEKPEVVAKDVGLNPERKT